LINYHIIKSAYAAPKNTDFCLFKQRKTIVDKTFFNKKLSGLDVRFEAQKIAFAPVVFQGVRLLWKMGILAVLSKDAKAGLTPKQIAKKTDVSTYGATVLLETGLSAGVVDLVDDEKYIITRLGNFVLGDKMTQINFNFNNDVCYQGMFYLEEAIRKEQPAGLKVFGTWPTVYDALSKLPDTAQKSWFDFDHFYSDSAFNEALPIVFKDMPAKIMDVGGNTGKWSLRCLNYNPDVRMTIIDLPGQLEKARENIDTAGYGDRFDGKAVNILDDSSKLPVGHDTIWMSQFLCCFKETEIVSILKKAAKAMDQNTKLFIMDTYWDRQPYDIASYCLINTSPYFTAMANGNSRMYRSKTMQDCIRKAGLTLLEDTDELGLSHTLMLCKLK